jgi:hypothetical protein
MPVGIRESDEETIMTLYEQPSTEEWMAYYLYAAKISIRAAIVRQAMQESSHE